MLPTYPKICEIRSQANQETIQQLVEAYSPIFRQIRSTTQFEGRSHAMLRHEDGESDTNTSPISAEVSIPVDLPLTAFTMEVLVEALNNVASQLAEGKSGKLFKAMDEATEASGNVVDGRGRAVTADLILEAYEKMHHEFSEEGTWRPPTILSGSNLTEEVARLMASPDFQARLKQVLARKHDEHRRREAGRVLAG